MCAALNAEDRADLVNALKVSSFWFYSALFLFVHVDCVGIVYEDYDVILCYDGDFFFVCLLIFFFMFMFGCRTSFRISLVSTPMCSTVLLRTWGSVLIRSGKFRYVSEVLVFLDDDNWEFYTVVFFCRCACVCLLSWMLMAISLLFTMKMKWTLFVGEVLFVLLPG